MSFLNAFILSFSDFGEHDRRFSLLTKEHGKINAICKSILRPNAKLAGHLDIPSLSWAELVWSVRGWQITQALELESYTSIRKNPEALRAVLALASSLDRLLFAEDDHEFKGRLTSTDTDNQSKNIYELWYAFLKTMEQHAGRALPVNYIFIQWQCMTKILHELGFLPDTFVCARCGNKFHSAFITYIENQLYCDNCRKALSLVGQLFPKSVLDLMHQGLRGAWFPESSYAVPYIQLARLFEYQSTVFVI